MTAYTPSTLPLFQTVADALPGVEIVARPGCAWVFWSADECVIVEEYHEEGEPRALVCYRHGAQRHNWNKAMKRYECKVCTSEAS